MRRAGRLERAVVLAQPVDKCAHLIVAPHPGREAGKSRPLGGRIFKMPNVVIDTRGIRPVALDGNKMETLLDDQFARDALAHAIEFGSAVSGLAQ